MSWFPQAIHKTLQLTSNLTMELLSGRVVRTQDCIYCVVHTLYLVGKLISTGTEYPSNAESTSHMDESGYGSTAAAKIRSMMTNRWFALYFGRVPIV